MTVCNERMAGWLLLTFTLPTKRASQRVEIWRKLQRYGTVPLGNSGYWGEEKIGIVDLHSMTVVKRLATAAKPNGSVYAAPFRKVYVSNTLGKAVAAVEVDKDEIVKTIEFGSETGMPQYDSSARKVYVNLRNTNEVAEIDPATDTAVGRYPVDGCKFNHGMAVDSKHHRGFILCSGNWTCPPI